MSGSCGCSECNVDREERALVLGVLLGEVLAWVRCRRGVRTREARWVRALSNAGLWCIGRLQTDADREHVVEGLSHARREGSSVRRDAHTDGLRLVRPRYAMSLLRGPMTGAELRAARAGLAGEPAG